MAQRTDTETEHHAARLYHEEGMTLAEVGDKIGTTATTVKNILDRLGVGTRGCSGAQKLHFSENRQHNQKPEWMEQAIGSAYLSGFASTTIAEAFDVSQTAVLGALDRLGIGRRSVSEAQKMRDAESFVETPKEHRDEMVHLYQEGMSAEAAATLFDCSKTVCLEALNRRGVERRSQSEAQRQYEVHDTFFDDIDTGEKAYWLGFLVADGYVDGDGSVVLSLQARDKRHVEAFRDAVSPERPVYEYDYSDEGDKSYPYASVEVRSQRLCEGLEQWGVVQAKCHTVTPPDLPEEMMRHFWRGVVDGDGCITQYTKKSGEKADGSRYEYEMWQLSLAGNRYITRGFADFINPRVNSTVSPYQGSDGTFRLSYDSDKGKQAVSLLYQDCQVALNRKLSKARKMAGGRLIG